MKYELRYQEKMIGEVLVKKIGLYYEIECCFAENRSKRFRLVAVSNNGEVDLGECRFFNGQFRLIRRLPINAVGREMLRFYIIAVEDSKSIYPIREDKPFQYIDKLDKAALIIVKGEKRIRI